MKVLLVNLPSLGFSYERFAPNFKVAKKLIDKGYKFDVILYNTHTVDCDCCCDITGKLRNIFKGILIAVISDGMECCYKSRQAGADNYISVHDYNRHNIADIIHHELNRLEFQKTLKEYRALALTT